MSLAARTPFAMRWLSFVNGRYCVSCCLWSCYVCVPYGVRLFQCCPLEESRGLRCWLRLLKPVKIFWSYSLPIMTKVSIAVFFISFYLMPFSHSPTAFSRCFLLACQGYCAAQPKIFSVLLTSLEMLKGLIGDIGRYLKSPELASPSNVEKLYQELSSVSLPHSLFARL